VSGPVLPFDQQKAEAIIPGDAVRLLQALRQGDEGVWLQTFQDGPLELYGAEQRTSKAGKPYTVYSYCVADVPSVPDKTKRETARVSQTGNYTLEKLKGGPFTVANSSARVGVFFCVNVLQPDAERRSSDTVQRVAAVFVDLDGTPLPADGFPIKPTAIAESSPGRWHVYWAVVDLPLSDFTAVQKHLAELYGGDTSVSDLARVMRMPGYWHGKQEAGFQTHLVELNEEAQYSRAELLEGFSGLGNALAAAEVAEAKRIEEAARRIQQAAVLRSELASGSVANQAEAQRKYGQAALLDEVGQLGTTLQGGRNNQLFKAAAALGECVAAGLLDLAEVESELTAAALAAGLYQGEVETTLQSGLTKGLQSPRDLSQVGQLAGKKKAKKTSALAIAAARVQHPPVALTADQIPDPEGEGGSYSDEQLRGLLGLTWPVVGLDTDKAHSYRLHDHAGEDLGYVAEFSGYVAWNGRQWLSGGKDGAGQIEAKRRVQGLGVYMRPEVDQLLGLYSVLDLEAKRAAQESGADSKQAKDAARKAEAMEKAYYNHGRAARSTESDGKQKAILSSAKPLFVKSILLFEPRPWVVGFQNGTWDRGAFRAAQREDHMLTLAAVEYQPDADRRDWMEVLERITGGDADLARTLQDVAGYALSGASSLRLLPWLYGEAGTGKSTFSELLATVLGDMAATVDPKLFSADAARERLGAAIWGKRVALCAEAGNARLDAEALKTLSGGDRLSVRMLYAEGFSARASHVLIMVANDAPRVEAYDEALKDRVLALPFDHPLKAGKPLLGGRRIEELRQDLASSLVQGFTAWAVEGLARVHRLGDVHRATASRAATRGFWESVDPLHDFWSEQGVSELVLGIGVTAFRKRYEAWCEGTGTRPLSSQKFNKACRSVGLDAHSNGKEKQWRLFATAKFPVGAPVAADHFDQFDPISVKPNFSSYTREEEKGFMENSPKVVKVVSSEAAPCFAPASGEL